MAKRPTRRSSAASRRADKAKRSAIFKILGVAVAVAAVGGVYFKVVASNRHLDPSTLCPTKPDSVTVLLVDVTDPMNVPQRQDFMNQLTRLKNSIPRYGQLIVAKVDATSSSLLSPVIVRCNPGTATDVNEATGNPAAVQKLWNEGFDAPLRAAFDQMGNASGAEKSPILESIQSVALTEFQKPSAEGKPHRLIVASDLLQNTSDISFYKSLPAATEFVKSAAFRKVRTDLRDTEVELWMLERTDATSTQPTALAELWDQLIAAQGGNVKRIYNVSG